MEQQALKAQAKQDLRTIPPPTVPHHIWHNPGWALYKATALTRKTAVQIHHQKGRGAGAGPITLRCALYQPRRNTPEAGAPIASKTHRRVDLAAKARATNAQKNPANRTK